MWGIKSLLHRYVTQQAWLQNYWPAGSFDQILLHNSEDLIYIGNGRGTAWVELTSNGKIDVYAKDSINFRTETDLNIKAGDPKYQAIDQSKLVPLLTAALQEAVAKIEVLETKVAALEAA